MKKIIITIVVLLVVAAGIYFIVMDGKTKPAAEGLLNTGTPTTTQGTATTTEEASKSFDVTIQNFSFSPNPLTISKGDTVVFTNKDSAQHQVKGNGFESGIMQKNDTFRFQFNTLGTFDYICSIHPVMKGNIIVR